MDRFDGLSSLFGIPSVGGGSCMLRGPLESAMGCPVELELGSDEVWRSG